MAPIAALFVVALLPIQQAVAFGHEHLSYPRAHGGQAQDSKKLWKRPVGKRAPSPLPIKIVSPEVQTTTTTTTSSRSPGGSPGYHAGVYVSPKPVANAYVSPGPAVNEYVDAQRPAAAVTSGANHRLYAAVGSQRATSSSTMAPAANIVPAKQTPAIAIAAPQQQTTPSNRRTKTHPQAAVAAQTTPASAVASPQDQNDAPPAASSSAQSVSGAKLNTVVATGTGSWKVQNDWSGSDFLNDWDFFNYPDPTHGLVDYVSASEAKSAGLAYVNGASFIMKVDDSTKLSSGQSRKSVRITSRQTVGMGSLIIFDANKIPYGPSTWPAFWTVGPDWPSGGEIDIVENVHESLQNQMTLHTTAGCTLSQPMAASGAVESTNCDANVNYNIGCGVVDPSPKSFGPGFSNSGGGVWATIIDPSGITIWFFERGSVPSDIKSRSPNPANWGAPKARWSGSSCNIAKYFADQTIVINTTLCGDWAGGTWAQQGIAGTCADAVANPDNFHNAVWDINSVTVYTR